jgi:hypothetical protein
MDGSNRQDVENKIKIEADKYAELRIIELKVYGPAATEGGGTQYAVECFLI